MFSGNNIIQCTTNCWVYSYTSHTIDVILCLSYTENWNELQYPFTRKVIPNRIQDIQDGKAYQKLTRHGGFLAVPGHTGLILCSDGVRLFKSSGQTFWPDMLAVTSLPPAVRMNTENVILAGIWQGPIKPPMTTILTPVLDKIYQLQNKGISVCTSDGPKTVKACLLVAVFNQSPSKSHGYKLCAV